MKNKSFLLIGILITIEAIIIAGLILILLKNQHTIEVKSSATSIDTENILGDNSNLSYYYDLKPNTNQTWENPKLSDIVTTYTVNNDGLNEMIEYSIPKPERTFRIITLGDSNTFGLYVHEKDNYSSVLEKQLAKKTSCSSLEGYEVINLGVPGYDPTYEIERFKLKGLKYEPDLVIWQISNEDLHEVLEYMRPIINKNITGTERFKARYIAKRILENTYSESEILTYQQKIFDRFTILYKGPLLIVNWTGLEAPQQEFINQFISHRPNSYFLTVSHLIKNDMYIPNDSHLNKNGHLELGNHIYSFLRENNLICPK